MKIAGSLLESYYTSCSRHWPGPWHCLDLTWLAVYCVLHQSTDNLLIHTPRLAIYNKARGRFRKPICNRISDDGTMRIKMISGEDTAWVVVSFSVQWRDHSQMEKKVNEQHLNNNSLREINKNTSKRILSSHHVTVERCKKLCTCTVQQRKISNR